MPIKTSAQFKLMAAAATGNAIGGPPPDVAKEFLAKTSHAKKSSFAHAKKNKKFNPFEKK